MCSYENREAAMVIIDPGTPERQGRDGVWCDPCLVPLVKALNDGGVRTTASCCGHGTNHSSIALADGRWLLVMDDAEFQAEDTRVAASQPVQVEVTTAEECNNARFDLLRKLAAAEQKYADVVSLANQASRDLVAAEAMLADEREWWESIHQSHTRHLMILKDASLKRLAQSPTDALQAHDKRLRAEAVRQFAQTIVGLFDSQGMHSAADQVQTILKLGDIATESTPEQPEGEN